jgi:hypothetical protein
MARQEALVLQTFQLKQTKHQPLLSVAFSCGMDHQLRQIRALLLFWFALILSGLSIGSESESTKLPCYSLVVALDNNLLALMV